MATIDVNAVVVAPPTVTVELVRADALGTENVFRVCFEVFLALASGTYGAILTTTGQIPSLLWVLLGVTGVPSAGFAILATVFAFRARQKSLPRAGLLKALGLVAAGAALVKLTELIWHR